MIFEIKNRKHINNVSIDLSKTLIIFVGQNKTGKTDILSLIHHTTDGNSAYITNELTTEQRAYYFSGKSVGLFCDLADELEQKTVGEEISTGVDGEIYVGNVHRKGYRWTETSSIISLSRLVFYLRFHAKENTRLIYEEPEANLHPDNQIVVARILAKIVNRGIKVIISTHSDYIIRELDNLMLMATHKDSEDTKELMERYGYDENELLNPNEVGAYVFSRNNDSKIDITELVIDKIDGIQVSTINDVINAQNRVSEALYSRLVSKY